MICIWAQLSHLEQSWYHSVVVKHDTVEGAIDAVVDVVHERRLVTIVTTCITCTTGTFPRGQYWSLGKYIDSESMCGACKVSACVKQKENRDIFNGKVIL